MRFFTCEPNDVEVTGCSEGNAVYNATLNAVFIDRSLVSAERWLSRKTFGEQGRLPFLEVYLHFILLHELGHYSLHRNSLNSGLGSARGLLERFEAEADSFAIKHFIYLLESDTSGQFFDNEILSNLAFEPEARLTAADKALCCLALVGRNINLAMLFGVSPYSVFYSDKAHPTFIQRSRSFLATALELFPVHNQYYAKALLTERYLEQLEKTATAKAVVEIRCPEQIMDMTFDSKGLLIHSMDSNFFHATYDELSPNKNKLLKRHELERTISTPLYADFDKLFSFANGDVFSAGINELMKHTKGRWLGCPGSLASLPTGQLLKMPVQRQPASDFVIIPSKDSLYMIGTKGLVQIVSIKNLEKEIRLISANDSLELLWNDMIIDAKSAHVIIMESVETSSHMTGVAVINLVTGRISSVHRFRFGNNYQPTPLGLYQNKFLYNEKDQQFYLLTAGNMSRSGKMDLFQVFPSQNPILVAQRQFVGTANGLNQQLHLEPGIYPAGLVKLSADEYLCNWDDDMIYHINLSKRSIEPVFYFGAGTLRLRVTPKKMVAIFSPTAYKFYVIQL